MSTFDLSNPAKPKIVKDPDAVLNYTLDWTAWMEDDDTIVTVELVCSGSLNADSHSIVSTIEDADVPTIKQHLTTAILSGGTSAALESACFRITTANGLTEDRTIWLQIKDR